jgi:hypothetical protein
MIDYFCHAAVLDEARAGLVAFNVLDPKIAEATARLWGDVDGNPDAALLGAFVDHLIAHASANGRELALLETAASQWTQGLALYNQVASSRKLIEEALANPSATTSITSFNAGASGLNSMRLSAAQLVAGAQTLKDEVDKFEHLPPHPRQKDTPPASWDWGNLFLARRGDAFVRALFRAKDSRSRAFAFGALTSYAGNVVGSSYLSQTVGGPRRLHRYRDRLARNAAGRWVSANIPGRTLPQLAKHVAFTGPLGIAQLPNDIATTLQAAFSDAFPGITPPDVDLGLGRLARHLELLSVFVLPAPPTPPDPALGGLMSTLETSDLGGGIHTTTDPPGTGAPSDPAPGSSTTDPTGADSQPKTGGGCLEWIIAAIVVALVFLIDCIVQLIDHGDCDPGNTWKDIVDGLADDEGSDPAVSTTTQLLTIASTPSGAHLVQQLYETQLGLNQAFSRALAFLAISGLIYPDALQMSLPLYKQFTKTPTLTAWPKRLEANPRDRYHAPPISAIENPGMSVPYPVGATPAAFISGTAFGAHATAAGIALSLWHQIAGGTHDSQNLDMDGDRAPLHPAWAVVAGTSITDDPLSVQTLNYKAV